ncbi:MAG: methylmalonyl-CoA epimerase [Pseudomonadales bacterium]|nr:methylmalonyl-CoA epimerase [Pseudomonadales bacterium]
MIIGLDHIAIAVPDLQAAIARFAEDFGLQLTGTEDVPDAKTSTAFLSVDKTQVELVHPLNGEGPIQKYLDKKGGGLHHLCFRSDDVKADMVRLAAKGYEFLSDEPKPGAHGTIVAWIHPKSTDGILIEIAQYGDDHHD